MASLRINTRTRRIILVILLFALVSVLVATPITNIGRDWVLSKISVALTQSGLNVQYLSASGVPWTGVTLDAVDISGNGMDIQAEQLAFRYSLPSLITGRLPISIFGDGLEGRVNLAQLLASQSSSSGGLRVVIKNLALSRIGLDITDVPFALPDLDLDNVRIEGTQQGFIFTGTISTDGGTVSARASIHPDTMNVDVEVTQADVKVARHWWPGAIGGTVSGKIRFSPDGIRGDFDVREAVIEELGREFSRLAGPVTLNYPRIEGRLTGHTLGGEATVVGSVEIEDRSWEATATGSTNLQKSVVWLGELLGTPDLRDVPIKGTTDVTIKGSGWTAYELNGNVTGNGHLIGKPLEDLNTDFSYSSTRAPQVTLSAFYANGSIAASVNDGPAGLILSAQGANLELLPELTADAEISLRSIGGTLSGGGSSSVNWSLGGRDLKAELLADFTPDGWPVSISATDDLGASANGTVLFQEQHLTGQVYVQQLELPYLKQTLDLGIEADGPLTALPIFATIKSGIAVSTKHSQWQVDPDLNGTITTVARGWRLTEIVGDTRSADFLGELDILTGDGQVDFSISPVPIAGSLNALAGLTNGQLRINSGDITVEGNLDVHELGMHGVSAGPLSVRTFLVTNDGSPNLELTGGPIDVELDNTSFAAEFKKFALSGGGQDALISGEISGTLADVGNLTADLTADIGGASVDLTGNGPTFNLSIALPAGYPVTSATLLVPALFEGSADLIDGTVAVQGAVGPFNVQADGFVEDGLLYANSVISAAGRSVTASIDSLGALAINGDLDLTSITQVLSLPLSIEPSGHLSASLSGDFMSPVGLVELSAATGPTVTRAVLNVDKGTVEAEGTIKILDEIINFQGSVYPAVNLMGLANYGQLSLVDSTLSGSGEVPEIQIGEISLPSQLWHLSGDLNAEIVEMSIGETQGSISWGPNGLDLNAKVIQGATWGNSIGSLTGTYSLGSSQPNGYFEGDLLLESSSFQLQGSPSDVKFTGTAILDDFLDTPWPLLGEADMEGSADLVNLSLETTFAWDSLENSLGGKFSAVFGDQGIRVTSGSLSGDAIEIAYDGLSINLATSGFNPNAFIDLPVTVSQITGILDYELEQQHWNGKLRAAMQSFDVLGTPGDSVLTLEGRNNNLFLDGMVSDGPVQAEIQGLLLPTLQLGIKADIYAGLGSLIANMIATDEGLVADGVLSFSGLTSPGGKWAIDPLDIPLAFDSETKTIISRSPRAEININLDSLTGSLQLGLQAFGATHTARLFFEGTPLLPLVEGNIDGSLVNGSFRAKGGELDFSGNLDPKAITSMPKRIGPIMVTGRAGFNGTWTAYASTRLENLGLPLNVSVNANGSGQEYTGTGQISSDGPLLPFELSGSGLNARIESDLSALNTDLLTTLLPFPVTLISSGSVIVKTGIELSTAISYQATGSLAGTPIRIDVTGDHLAGKLVANATGHTVTGTWAESTLNLEASGPTLFLAGAAEIDDKNLKTNIAGSVLEEPFQVTAEISLNELIGNLEVNYGSAKTTGQFSHSDRTSVMDLHIFAPNDSPLPLPIEAQAKLNAASGVVHLSSLEATSDQTWALKAEGPIFPDFLLTGAIDHYQTGFKNVEFTGRKENNSYVVDLVHQAIFGQITADNKLNIFEASLEGETSLPGLGGSARTDLFWSIENGFLGEASAILEPADGWNITVNASGQGDLYVTTAAQENGKSVLTANTQIGSLIWSDPRITGSADIELEIGAIIGLPPQADLRVVGNPLISGSLYSPTLEGKLGLLGILNMDGFGSLDLTGGRIELNKEDSSITGTVDSSGWKTWLSLKDISIQRLLPTINSPFVDLEAQTSNPWTSTEIAISHFRVHTPSSSVVGKGSLNQVLKGDFELDLALSDLPITEADLSGRLRGPVSVHGLIANGYQNMDLTGLAAVENASFGGLEASLIGDVYVSGTIGQPTLQGTLNGSNTVSGSVSGSASLATGNFELHSTLAAYNIGTDLKISRSDGVLKTEGSLDHASGSFRTNPKSQESNRFLGNGLFNGWHLKVDEHLPEAHLYSRLSSLNNGFGGEANLNLSFPNRRGTWLDGRINNATVFGLEIGSAIVNATRSQGTITGSQFSAIADLATLSWTLEQMAAQLPRGLNLAMSGSGDASSAALSAILTGNVEEQTLMPIALQITPDYLGATGQGTFLGGTATVNVSATPTTGWSGGIDLSALDLGSGLVTTSTTVKGLLEHPEINSDLSIFVGNYLLEGTALAVLNKTTLERLEFNQVLKTPSAKLLTVRGELNDGPGSVTISSSQSDDFVLTIPALSPTATISARGRTEVTVGPTTTVLSSSPQGHVLIEVSLPPLEGLAVEATIPPSSVNDLLASLRKEGLLFQGTNRSQGKGRVMITPMPSITIEDFAYYGTEINGTIRGSLGLVSRAESGLPQFGLAGELSGVVDLPHEIPYMPNVLAGRVVPFVTKVAFTDPVSEVGTPPDSLTVYHNSATGEGHVIANISWDNGLFDTRFTYGKEVMGSLHVQGLPWQGTEIIPSVNLNANVDIANGSLVGSATALSDVGNLHISGNWGLAGLVPSGLISNPSTIRAIDARVSSFTPARLPIANNVVPNLEGEVNGIIRVRGDRYIGQLVSPEMSVLETVLPTQIEFDGNLSKLSARGSISGSSVSLSVTPEGLTAVSRLERFPGEVIAKAVIGDPGVTSEVTGLLRLTYPFKSGMPTELRLATEHVRLERAGVITEGNVSLSLIDQILTVDQASFRGAGRWEASGQLTPDILDFELVAIEADFTPILSLFPRLAAFGIGASGNLEMKAAGTLNNPSIGLTSDSLGLTLTGGNYLLSDANFMLDGDALQLTGELRGLDQLKGIMTFIGRGKVRLDPATVEDLLVDFSGSMSIPIVGVIEDLSGKITTENGDDLRIKATGNMGNPIQIEGVISPLSLTVKGTDLLLSAPDILLESSRANMNINLSLDKVLRIGGLVTAEESHFTLGIKPNRRANSTPNKALENIVFDDLRILSPQQIYVSESFGSLELGLDLRLLGNAATPKLSGQATALRGILRFSGRNFDVVSAEATFDPSRGVYPEIMISGRTTFEKSRVLLSSEPGLEFIGPNGTNSFNVNLMLEGEIIPSEIANEPFTLDFAPTLTSNAVIQEPATDAAVSQPRPLTENELFTLVTLGRIEVQPNLAGEGGLAPTVVTTALDTAFSLLLLSELQDFISEALALDVVEIRTTAFSSVLDYRDEDPFGVSFRLGRYLRDDLFASYQIGSFDDPEQIYFFTNELRLSYNFGTLGVDLSGRVDFERERGPTPVAGLSLAIHYALSDQMSLDYGFDFNSLQFGVSFRF